MNVLRSRLNHSQRDTGTDKDMPVFARPDVGIHVAEVVLNVRLVIFLRDTC